MQAKDDIKEMAQTFREAADILDEIAELDDKEGMTREERKEKEEELSARFLLKMIKIALYEYCVKVLKGVASNDSQFIYIQETGCSREGSRESESRCI